MATNLKQRTQEAIDALSAGVEGCSLAMLIDGETGLILCKTSSTVVSQDQLDDIATTARTRLNGALATALAETGSSDDLLTGMQIGREETVIGIKTEKSGQDALICKFTSSSNRTNLSSAAHAIFDLSTEVEAA